jgi:hypothetical protein
MRHRRLSVQDFTRLHCFGGAFHMIAAADSLPE